MRELRDDRCGVRRRRAHVVRAGESEHGHVRQRPGRDRRVPVRRGPRDAVGGRPDRSRPAPERPCRTGRQGGDRRAQRLLARREVGVRLPGKAAVVAHRGQEEPFAERGVRGREVQAEASSCQRGEAEQRLRAAGRRGRDDRRQLRLEPGAEVGTDDDLEQGRPVERHELRAARRGPNAPRDRRDRSPVRERGDLPRQIRVDPPARRRSTHGGEAERDALQGVERERVGPGRGDDGVEQHSLHVVAMGERVRELDLRPVRRAPEPDLVHPERLPHRIDVLGVRGRRVERARRAERLPAGRHLLRHGSREGAVQEPGAARAARVEGDERVAGEDGLPDGSETRRGRRPARSPGPGRPRSASSRRAASPSPAAPRLPAGAIRARRRSSRAAPSRSRRERRSSCGTARTRASRRSRQTCFPARRLP